MHFKVIGCVTHRIFHEFEAHSFEAAACYLLMAGKVSLENVSGTSLFSLNAFHCMTERCYLTDGLDRRFYQELFFKGSRFPLAARRRR